jgi:hypothetical protein
MWVKQMVYLPQGGPCTDLCVGLPEVSRQMGEPVSQVCPHCGVGLQGAPIPVEHRHLYYGGKTHFRREIGVEHPEIYDGMLYYRCPDCSGAWHRFPEGHPLRAKAEPFVRKPHRV